MLPSKSVLCIIFYFSIRGRLGAMIPLARNIGILVAYISGALIKYEHRPYIFIVLPITFLMLFYSLPSTAQFYFEKANLKVYLFTKLKMLISIMIENYLKTECRKGSNLLQGMQCQKWSWDVHFESRIWTHEINRRRQKTESKTSDERLLWSNGIQWNHN